MSYDLAVASQDNVTYGVLVESVVQGGPASQAGLNAGTTRKTVDGTTFVAAGDVIVSINGTRITKSDALSTWLEEHALPGQTVELGIIRGHFDDNHVRAWNEAACLIVTVVHHCTHSGKRRDSPSIRFHVRDEGPSRHLVAKFRRDPFRPGFEITRAKSRLIKEAKFQLIART